MTTLERKLTREEFDEQNKGDVLIYADTKRGGLYEIAADEEWLAKEYEQYSRDYDEEHPPHDDALTAKS